MVTFWSQTRITHRRQTLILSRGQSQRVHQRKSRCIYGRIVLPTSCTTALPALPMTTVEQGREGLQLLLRR